ncbi:hypothetical protein AAVH_15596 [Aphelenchoides avenae]|nr:hypothetical protein AAVH_15596 [Aphelenchus avenae]
MFRHATYVQLRNNTVVEIHVKTANKLSFAARDYSANMGKLVMDVSECIIHEAVTMAPVKYDISWKCYLSKHLVAIYVQLWATGLRPEAAELLSLEVAWLEPKK